MIDIHFSLVAGVEGRRRRADTPARLAALSGLDVTAATLVVVV